MRREMYFCDVGASLIYKMAYQDQCDNIYTGEGV